MLTVERYRTTRFWALYENRQLLCVTVYKKGANAVKDRIERNQPLEPSIASEAAPEPERNVAGARRRARRTWWYR